VLAAYDYARASALLADLGKQMVQSGPFLVSTRPTVSDPGALFLFFDLSRVTPKLVWDWVREFCSLAAQERSWSEIELKRLALNVRNILAVAAKGYPGSARCAPAVDPGREASQRTVTCARTNFTWRLSCAASGYTSSVACSACRHNCVPL